MAKFRLNLKILLLIAFLAAGYVVLSGQEAGIELLWKSALTHAPDTVQLQNQAAIARIQADKAYADYSPSLVLDEELYVPYKAADDYAGIPSSNESTLTLALPLPGGTTVKIDGSYVTSRTWLGTDGWGVVQAPQAGITLVQSLYPWWLQGASDEPYKSRLDLKAKLRDTQVHEGLLTLLIQVSTNYVRLAQSQRSIQVLKSSLAFQQERLQAYREQAKNGAIPARQLLELEKTHWDDEKSLMELRAQAEEYENTLFQYCGIRPSLIDTGSGNLPDQPGLAMAAILGNISTKDLRFAQEESLAVQKKLIQAEASLRLQSQSPTISFRFGSSFTLEPSTVQGMGESWTKESTNTWSITAELNLSPLFSATPQRDQAVDELSGQGLNAQSTALAAQKKTALEQQGRSIQRLEEQSTRISTLLEQVRTLVDDLGVLKTQGAISEIDLAQAQLELATRQAALQNTQAELWLQLLVRDLL